MTRVGIATRDWTTPPTGETPTLGGSGYYRCGLVAKVLEEMGHDVVLGTLVGHDSSGELGVRTWDLENHGGFEVMLLQRWMFRGLPERIMRARSVGQVVINDVDDWWEGLDPSNLAFHTSSPRTSVTENRDHYRRVLGASTLLVCSTPFLVDRYARLAPTFLVRNCLDLDRWKPREPRDGPPVVGWVGALPWRSKGDVEALAGFLGPFLDRHGLRFLHAGAIHPGAFARSTRLDPAPPLAPRVDESPLVPIDGHERQFEGMDVTLVPLASKPFNEAKSCLKGVQAAAAGVPFIASNLPEYRWLRDERSIGLTARNPKAWVNHLERLLDPHERAMAAAANEAAVQGMGLHVLARHWDAILTAVG